MANFLDILFKRESTGSSNGVAPKGGSSSSGDEEQAKGQDIESRVTYAGGEHSSLSVPAFFRAMTLRGNTVSRLLMQYQKATPFGNFVKDFGPTRGRHYNYLLQIEPNPYMNWTVLSRKLDFLVGVRGNAYIYVERGLDGEIAGFWLCSMGTYIPGENAYRVTYYMGQSPVTVTAPADQVLHIRNSILTEDGMYGMSLLGFAARTLNLSATEDSLALDTMAKGGRKKLLLQEQAQQSIGLGKVNRQAMEDIRKKAAKDLPASDVIYVPNVASVTDISQSLTELELSTLKKLSVADVARFTGVPKSLLMDDSNSTYRTPDAAMLDFLNSCIAPLIEEIEDEFNRKLVGEQGWGSHRFHLCTEPLFRLDRKTQAEWNKNRLETGVVSINELRAEMELPPINGEGGDDHFVSANLIKAGSPKLSGETAPQEPPTDNTKKKGGAS